jgi:hypothetical protein
VSIDSSTIGSSVTIEEVTGTRLWSITLVGAGLPHQGAGWGHENRIPTEFYPGNFANGTQQVIGPKEGPTHMEGIWRRTMLLRSPCTVNGQLTATPANLWNYLEQISLGGARLRVTTTLTKTESIPGLSPGGTTTPGGQTQYQIVREGRMRTCRHTPLTQDDIKWEIEWRWVGRGGGNQQTAVSTRDSDPSASSAQVQSSITDAVALTGTLSPSAAENPLVPLSATPDTLGEYETVAPGMLSLFSGFNASLLQLQVQFGQTQQLSLQLGYTPSQINNSVLNLSVGTAQTVNDFTDSVGQVPFEVQSTSQFEEDVCFAAAATASAIQSAWTVRDAALTAAAKARALQSTGVGGGWKGNQQTQGTGPGQILTVYRTREGDTPQRVASQWYGNADRALDLLQANGLPLGQPSFPPGTVLIIPVLRTANSSG